jgi:hypothetical protein
MAAGRGARASHPEPAPGIPPAVERPGPSELRTTNPSGPVVTPIQARQITTTIFRLRAGALAAQDRRAFEHIDTGAVLESGVAACACLRERFGAITDMSVFVPRQASFPASFMAEVATTDAGTPSIENMVVVRSSAADTWRLAVENVRRDRSAVADPVGAWRAPRPTRW